MSLVLDIVLVVVLLAYLAQGWRLGFVRSLGAIAGVVAGAIAAAALAPWVGSLVPDDTGRVVATIVAAVVLILLGHAIGSGIGGAIGGVLRRSPLGPVDRLLGAAAGLLVSALAISVIASLAVALGVPYVAQPVASSVVLRTIDAATPPPVEKVLAQLRQTVLGSGIPQLGIALGGAAGVPVPQVQGGRAVDAAAASVVKITGSAAACRQEQSGSGFVVAGNRIMTNAHVVAGVTDPVVLTRSGQALTGRVTYFDRRSDIAVIAVRGLDAKTLPVGGTPAAGDQGVVAGYPLGGPYTTGGARVVRVARTSVPDVGGGGSSVRDIAALSAVVQPGNSGGPLLDSRGEVIGLVFAKSADQDDLGFAMTPDQFGGVAARAGSLTDGVSTGACIAD